ncbi:aminodeoxychorismate synthase component I [Bosea rubneri]|uniref:Probable branched-chain-amino-acid aminotransferase n=1 Tax=Bosea rubneri TaxID=3075434 RepID=A0ABU3SCL0_9HYPH|nr:aminodeoxychorismate synthase component I [Bosea sp. ZW T0_25]MDU0342512.1 aminodeoxychorismate synthase component I [Bosea sp. ZW T0_25]
MPRPEREVEIAALRAPFVLLDDRSTGAGAALLYAEPVELVEARGLDEVPQALARIEAGLASGLHAAGFLSYELGYAFEPRLEGRMPEGRALPLLWIGLFREPLALDGAALDRQFASLAAPPPLEDLAFGLDAGQHAAAVGRVLDYLRAGDAYQVNLTFPVRFRYEGDPLALYSALRASQPVAHGGIVATGAATLLSVSPELFVETQDGRATTRPMKGTVARGVDAAGDAAAMAALRADPKQRAENLMIVDLLRNDLGRVSEIGSVAVPKLFSVETYPTLHTLTSEVTGRLRPGLSAGELIRAMFPCGSVTGAPKLRAMEIIRELEAWPRDAYTGSIGAIAPNGDLRFNVAIRTARLLPGGEGVYGVGGGIVVDSEAASEFAECRLKARVLTDLAEDFGLFETLLWSLEAGYRRLDLHLQRLGNSAAELGFRFERERLKEKLAELADGFGNAREQRVRFELKRDGSVMLRHMPLPPEQGRALTIAIAAERADAADPFARHKTTRRARHERCFVAAEVQGCDDALLLNRQGFVTETSRANVFLERDGLLLTPPAAHGLLPGVLRGELLEAGSAREAALRIEDLAGEARWFVGSSLRGLRQARLIADDPRLASAVADRE